MGGRLLNSGDHHRAIVVLSVSNTSPAMGGESRLIELPLQRYPTHFVTVSLVAGGWALLYALYRAYYGFGGTIGMFGTVTSQSEWHDINLAAAAILLVVALLPIAMLPLWRRRRAQRPLLAVYWTLTVAFIMHGVIDDIERVPSLTGALRIHYPALWATIDRHEADIQDRAFNETWFLIEGFL